MPIIWLDRSHPGTICEVADGEAEARLKRALEAWSPPRGGRLYAAQFPITTDGLIKVHVWVEFTEVIGQAWTFLAPASVASEVFPGLGAEFLRADLDAIIDRASHRSSS